MQMVMPLRRRRAGLGPALQAVPRTEPDLAVAASEFGASAPGDLSEAAGLAAPDADVAVCIRRIELGSLASVAVRTALVVTTIGALAVLTLWTLADVGGLVGRFESFMRSIGFRDFHVASGDVLLGLVVAVAGVALTAATFVVLAGAAYNLLAATGGGLRVHLGAAVAPVRAAEASPEPARRADRIDVLPVGIVSQPVPDPAA